MTADIMFKELGYAIKEVTDTHIVYSNDILTEWLQFVFDLELKSFEMLDTTDPDINYKLLLAIKKKMEELGWDS